MPPNKKPWLQFALEAVLEGQKDVGGMHADLLKRVFDPKPLKRTAFPESYIEGDAQLHVCFGLAFSGRAGFVTRHYRDIFQNLPCGEEPERPKDHVGRKVLDTNARANPEL